jgi:hypothetical protein
MVAILNFVFGGFPSHPFLEGNGLQQKNDVALHD